MKKDTKQGSVIMKVLKDGSLADVSKEYLELGIDIIIESDILKDIPVVNSIVGVFNAVGSVSNQILVNKLLRFLYQLSEIPDEDRNVMINKLDEDDKFSGKAGAIIIEMIDRMESEKKPELAAKVLLAYLRNKITFEEFRRIIVALERVPSFDIDKLEEFSQVTIEKRLGMDESPLLSFVNAGLGKNNGGFGGGVIVPTNLCKIFVRVITDTI